MLRCLGREIQLDLVQMCPGRMPGNPASERLQTLEDGAGKKKD